MELLTDQYIVATGLSEKQHLVDHIAVTPPLAGASDWRLEVLPKTDADDVRLSDHPTVVVDAPGLRWPLPPAEQLDWEPVLAFLPALVGDDVDAGEWVAPREMSPGVFMSAIRHSVTWRSS